MLNERWIYGHRLIAADQDAALRKFVHRYTLDHTPAWAHENRRPDGSAYMPHFASDRDWLEHSQFAVTKLGRLDERVRYCMSEPTWPKGQHEKDLPHIP